MNSGRYSSPCCQCMSTAIASGVGGRGWRIAGVPTDAYWAWGLHETFIIVIPSKDLVIARAGDHAWHPTNSEHWNGDYQVLAPFITPIVQAAE